MVPLSLSRNQSQPKGLTSEEKGMMPQQLFKIIQLQEQFNIIQTLFGYTLGTINTPLRDKFLFELKMKFIMVQQQFDSKNLQREGIALIVVNSIEIFKRNIGSITERQTRMLEAIQFNTAQTALDCNFLYQKWHDQSNLDEQNKKNEMAFKKFLEEEAHENKKKMEKVEGQGWDCQVCMCEIDREKFGILECSHIFHPECIGAYLKSKIEGGQTDIACPMEGCGIMLDVADIYQYSEPNLKKKFEKFTFNKFVEKNDTSTAWCPTAGCSAAFEFDEALDNYRCPACSKHYRLTCRCLYHHGMSCAEYRISNSFEKHDQDFMEGLPVCTGCGRICQLRRQGQDRCRCLS